MIANFIFPFECLKFKSNIFLKNFKLPSGKQTLKYNLSHISVINTFALFMSGTSENALLLTLQFISLEI